ncbi:hypothetical protein ABTN36_18435, partial [Acinetobacter baumannii]
KTAVFKPNNRACQCAGHSDRAAGSGQGLGHSRRDVGWNSSGSGGSTGRLGAQVIRIEVRPDGPGSAIRARHAADAKERWHCGTSGFLIT